MGSLRLPDVIFILFIVAIAYMAVRPGSPAPDWVTGLGSMLSGSITLVTAG
jgi:hypothetical protein